MESFADTLNEGFGQAVMNRLLKAAGHKVIVAGMALYAEAFQGG